MKTLLAFLVAVLALWLIQPEVWADIIRMKNGQRIEGKFLGGTEQRIRVQTADGTVDCPVKEILTITFSSPSFEMTPTPESKQKALILIPGTRVSVRLLDMLDTIQSKKDDWFGVTLDAALVVEGIEIAPKGAMAHGQVIQAEQGKYGSALVITLREIILKQQIIPIVTTNYTVWDRPQETVDASSLKRQRILRIAPQTFIEFKTTEPVKIEVSK